MCSRQVQGTCLLEEESGDRLAFAGGSNELTTKMQKLAAEVFGTFCLVFSGTAAIVINQASGGTITHVGIALTFGLIVLSMIYSLGDVSGCHLNPAVTIGFFAAKRFEGRLVGPYIAAQLLGASLASASVRWMFPMSRTLGATLPVGDPSISWGLEFFLTLMLMFVVLSVSTGSRERGAFAGVAVGSLIALEALFAGPVSGASMNPARSFGPALVSGRLDHLWIYLTAPVAGAVAGVLVYALIHGTSASEAVDGRSPEQVV